MQKLPNDIQKLIASYLDNRSLCFFSRASRSILENTLPELLNRQKNIFLQINAGIVSGTPLSVYYILDALNKSEINSDSSQFACENKHHNFASIINVPSKIVQIIVKVDHTLILTERGLYVCGENMFGQLGLGHNKRCNNFTRVENLHGILLKVMGSNSHTFILTDAGLYACGYNEYGQLGLGHNNNCNIFTRVENVRGTIHQILASRFYSMILTDQGLYACGNNEYGQLGLGHNNNCNIFTRVENVRGTIHQILASGFYSMILTDQELYTCGNNEYGQLGLGHNNNCNTFTRVENIRGTVQDVLINDLCTLVLTNKGLFVNEYMLSGDQPQIEFTKNYNTLTPIEKLPQEFKKFLFFYQKLNKLKKINERTLSLKNDTPYNCGFLNM